MKKNVLNKFAIVVSLLWALLITICHASSQKEDFLEYALQKFFPFESVSFNYKVIRKQISSDREISENGRFDIVDLNSFRNSGKIVTLSNDIITSKKFKEEVILDGKLYSLTRNLNKSTEAEILPSNGLIDSNKGVRPSIALIWREITNTPVFTALGTKNIKFVTAKIDEVPYPVLYFEKSSRAMYFSPTTGLLVRVDLYAYAKSEESYRYYVSESFILDKYIQKEGFYFPTKITQMNFKIDRESVSTEKPIASLEIDGEKIFRIESKLKGTSEYEIDGKSLTFNSVNKNKLKLVFPNGCRVRDNFKGKFYTANDGVEP